MTIAETVASVSGRDPLSLEPLSRTIDPDALESYLRAMHERADESNVTVRFAYEGRTVGVDADGKVYVDTDPGRI